MENENENENHITDLRDFQGVEVAVSKPKQKRTSKTWLVTVNNGAEEYVVTIKGVTSAEAAIEKATADGLTIVSVKPARTFK